MDKVEGTDWKIAYSRLALRWNEEGASPQTAGVQRCLSTAGKGWEKERGGCWVPLQDRGEARDSGQGDGPGGRSRGGRREEEGTPPSESKERPPMEQQCPREAFSCEPWWRGLCVRLCNWRVCVTCARGVCGVCVFVVCVMWAVCVWYVNFLLAYEGSSLHNS